MWFWWPRSTRGNSRQAESFATRELQSSLKFTTTFLSSRNRVMSSVEAANRSRLYSIMIAWIMCGTTVIRAEFTGSICCDRNSTYRKGTYLIECHSTSDRKEKFCNVSYHKSFKNYSYRKQVLRKSGRSWRRVKLLSDTVPANSSRVLLRVPYL